MSKAVPCRQESHASWFTATRWSIVLAAGRSRSPEADKALEVLCQTYWRPLYNYVRSKGYSEHDAEDLVQGFFEKLLQKDWLAEIRQEESRKFRTFLLSRLKSFIIDEWRTEHAQKRGGPSPHPRPGGDDDPTGEASHDPAIDLFDRQWAEQTVSQALVQLRAEHEVEGQLRRFELLRGYLAGDADVADYAEIAKALNVGESAVKTAIHRLRVRYRELVRQAIAATVTDIEDLEGEYKHLVEVLLG